MKVPLTSDQHTGEGFSEKDAMDKLKDKTAVANPGGLSDDELA